MNRLTRRLLPGFLVSTALVLSACDGGGTPKNPTFSVAAVGPTNALRTGDSTVIQVTVTPQDGFTGSVTAELVNAPVGVSAPPVTVTVNGATTMKLTVNTGTAAGILRLPVKVSGGTITQTDDAFAFVYRVAALSSGDNGCSTCVFDAMKGRLSKGYYWMLGNTNLSIKGIVQKVNLKTGSAKTFSVQVNERYADYIDSYYDLEILGGNLWIARSSHFTYSPDLLKFDLDGNYISRIEIGTSNRANMINLVKSSDSKAFFSYDSDESGVNLTYIGILNAEPGTVELYRTPFSTYSNLFGLTVDTNGNAWASSGTSSPPSLLKLSPSNTAFDSFSIGEQGRNFASSVTTDSQGNVWFYDYSANQISVLDPFTGSIRRYNSPYPDDNKLYASGGNIFYVGKYTANSATKTGILLLKEENSKLSFYEVPALVGNQGDINGFSTDPDGGIAYESSGEAYLLPAN